MGKFILPYFAIPIWVGEKKLHLLCPTYTYITENQHIILIINKLLVSNNRRTFAV